jgi:DNA cross-link repair 1C protein
MFLIEDDTKAILYTGDIRCQFNLTDGRVLLTAIAAEPWWVNSLIRNPVVLPYTHGHKRLDMMYLDTTFANEESIYWKFPTKAEGLKELLDKVMMYPKETVFHLHAWTTGYEDVWLALSSALRSQVDYIMVITKELMTDTNLDTCGRL